MSYDDDAIYEVPWCSDRWDLAILRRPNISFLGGPGRWVLYRPERLIVKAGALEDSRVRAALSGAEADRCEDDAVAIAQALGLELLRAPEERVVALVREINAIVPCSASLNHVPMPGPHHIHGDDDPLPAANPHDIPGSGGAGEGLTVLVLDTGCAAASTAGLNIASHEEEIVDEDNDGKRDPAAGHGTHISGIIARCAPGAAIISRRLLKSPVGEADDLHVAAALLDYGKADIINCSFGEQTLDDDAPLALQRALEALPASTIVVAASGNGGVSLQNWPAAFPHVIAVGAVGQPPGSSTWQQTDFSNHGPWVDCCAPGVGIVSTFLKLPDEGFGTGYASWTGTSMASPIVAGMIAATATSPAITASATADTRVQQAADAIRAAPTIGTVGAFVQPPPN
jgi:subtilisin family serine protease